MQLASSDAAPHAVLMMAARQQPADGGVRADIGAVAALDALRGVPFRNGDGNAALLISGSAEFELAVDCSG